MDQEIIDNYSFELNLVKITNKKTGKTNFCAVTDKVYDGMLACNGSNIDFEWKWDYLGDVVISSETLKELGFIYNDTI